MSEIVSSPIDNPRILTGGKMWGYSIGALGQVLPIAFFNTFAFQFYVYTIGLDPLLTSIGIFLGLFIFALSAPIFGVLIDNKKPNKYGKRRPLLLLSIPLLLVFMILAWTPPVCPIGNTFYWPTAIYLWIISVCIDLNQGLVVSTYLSMLSEQSTDQNNRVKIAGVQGIFMILGTVISIFVPIILQSKLEDPQDALWNTPSGAFMQSSLPIVGAIFGVVGAFCFISAFLSTDESFHLQNMQNQTQMQRLTVSQSFKKIFTPFRDKNYQYFLGNIFAFNMSLRILIVILMPFLTYVLLLAKSQFVLFILAILPFAAIGYILWNILIHKRGIKFSYTTSLLVSATVSFATFLFLVDFGTTIRLLLGVIIIGIAISSLVGGYLFPNPIIAQLIDDAPESIKSKQKDISGSYFGLYIFTYNIAQAISSLILGALLTGDNKENPVIINLTMPIAGILVLIGWLCLRKLTLQNKMK
jgi:Na+/melibiose symporter-like transporter